MNFGKNAHKVTTAAEAIRHIKDNDKVVFAHAAAVPQETIKALLDHSADYRNVQIIHMLGLGEGRYALPEYEENFRHNAIFVGANTRKAVEEDRADFTPCFFYEVPRLFRNGSIDVDVAVIQVSAPDENGNCSFGISCDYTKPAAENAKIVIAEVNDQMPYVYGDNFIHLDQIDHIIPCSYPLYELKPGPIGDIEKEIGRHCASLIKDGDTLQLGIGGIPDAVLMFLGDKKDLGIHTEMFSDGALELVKRGCITGAKKTLHPGKMVSTFLMGTKALYDFIDHNKDVELYPVDYVNNPLTIMQNENMISINSCIEVDLMGQVASESIGLRQFSGTGGQVDYVRGASAAKGGKSIIAIPSTAAGGKVSRIVPFLKEGTAVTTTRNDVDYIITEYGIAHLRGKTLRERAKALVAIAHPDHRPMLEEEFKKRFPKER
ncbi:MAG: acetyl-CoA hydrolase/transferase C-terminal domain-containing protein [Bacillota bacterium]|nr:acetyl-CoA hydrolase/transferase C-terminal domain-containing protein [Bacillota bacterium]